MKVYKGKTKLRILVDCKCDLSGYASVTLTALKPNGTVVDFPAVVKDVEKGIVFYAYYRGCWHVFSRSLL